MTILPQYHQFDGLTWNIGYLQNMLAYQGIVAPHTGKPLSEALLSGINGGICAGYFVFEYEGQPPHMHFLTRYPFNDHLPDQVFDRLGIVRTVQQTTNPQKAAANLLNALARGKPAAVWADVVSLYAENAADNTAGGLPDGVPGDYWFITPVLVYGYDLTGGDVNIADRARVPLTTNPDQLERSRARIKKTKFRQMTVDGISLERLPEAIVQGIQSCLDLYEGIGAPGAPGNFGFNALLKWADALKDGRGAKNWAKQFAPGARMYSGLVSGYRSLEVWFTGGSGARDSYADFLEEAAQVLDQPGFNDASAKYRQGAKLWRELAAALLPDAVEPFQQTRELLRRSYELFLTQGNASRDERREMQRQLDAIKAQVGADFPLSESEAAAMRADLRERVMALHDAEREAVDVLKAVMAEVAEKI